MKLWRCLWGNVQQRFNPSFFKDLNMIEWFTEDALLPTIMGGFLTLCLFGLFVYSSEKKMLMAALLVGLITASIATIERYIVTDKELAYALVYDGARAGRSNDTEAMLSFIKKDQTEKTARARNLLADTQFENIRVVGFKGFENNVDDDPQTGSVRFVVFGSGRHRSMSGPFNFEIELDLEKVDGQWKVTDFKYSDPRANLSP